MPVTSTWTDPIDWTDEEGLLVDGTDLNTYVSNNLIFLNNMLPVGVVVPYAGLMDATHPVPDGWLPCNGSLWLASTYPDLFNVLGYTYGGSEGTFAVPDLRGRLPLGKDNMLGASANRVTATQADNLGGASGSENHQLIEAEMPAHSHNIVSYKWVASSPTGVRLYHETNSASLTDPSVATTSKGGNQAHNNMPPYLTLNYIIRAKYD